MGLVTFAFNTSTYFQYNGKVYKRLHGTALASQVSVVVVVTGSLIQNTTKRGTIFLFLHVTLPRGTKTVTTFSRSCFHDHLHAQKTDAHQQASTQIIRMLSSARFHPVHKITTTIVLQHKFYEHFPMRLSMLQTVVI